MSSIMGGRAIGMVRNGKVAEKTCRVFEVQGSAPAPYVVVLGAGPVIGYASASCTCKAGQLGRACSHVMAARLMARLGREA